MKLSTKYRMKGFMREVKGTAKGIIAKISANRALGARGKLERLAGRLQGRLGKVHGVIGL